MKETQQERDTIATIGVQKLLMIERVSGLTTRQFFDAVLQIATNDAILRTALIRSELTREKSDVLHPAKSITDEQQAQPVNPS